MSLQDVRVSAFRVGNDAKQLQQRSVQSAETLKQHVSRLAALVQGSRSGETAIREIQEAQRAVNDVAVSLLVLQRVTDRFITATKG